MSGVKIKFSFIIIIFITAVFGFFERFMIIFLFVSLHEAGHIIVGNIFNVKTKKVIITPVGEIAIMKNTDNLSFIKKLIILISGPCVNIFFYIVFEMSNKIYSNNFFIFMANTNLLLAIFNLMPVYPLDGGRILSLILNKIFPIMGTNKIVIKISGTMSVLFMILGIIQLILFPYNISLLCIGLYLYKTRSKIYFGMTFDFYKRLMNKKNPSNELIPLKNFYIDKNLEIKKIIKKLYFDFYSVFYIYEDKVFKDKVFEWEIIEYIQKKGICGTISDIIEENIKS